MKKGQTNKDFAEHNEDFHKACKKAGCEATKRQASKFRNKKGIAWKEGR